MQEETGKEWKPAAQAAPASKPAEKKVGTSVADPDPGSGAFLTPGSGMGRKSASGSGIRDEQPGSYFLELRNFFLGLKYPGSGM